MASQSVKVIQCPTCGGSSSPKSEKCDFCGNYLLHLTVFEQRREPVDTSDPEGGYFRSLKRIYQVMITLGLGMAFVIYFLMFDSLSEDELVAISPVWFLLIIFGTCGLYTEKAVHLILNKKAENFAEALIQATNSLSPFIRIAVFLVFAVPFFLFGITKKFSSPLLISILVTLVWAAVLYVFLFGIFPSM
ncbi:MAG: hypothetical protein KDD63_06420 [Bacteroidetes bacterium]|nr:hypothetical protein [Bacteroidota bacterium]MCB0841648.1 hypothetical protein [Bacteroidota bacterium]MCB0851834.1 hypothetical protein [Bacteroidota bacterium]